MKNYKIKVSIFFKDNTKKTFFCTVYDCKNEEEAKTKLRQDINIKFPDVLKVKLYEPELIDIHSSMLNDFSGSEDIFNNLMSVFGMNKKNK